MTNVSAQLALARRCAAKMLEADECTRSMGIHIEIPAAGSAVASMRVRDDMLNGFNICHGGVVFLLADTAFAFACNAYDRQTLSVAATIDWRRQARRGEELRAIAREVSRDGRHGEYSVRVENQDAELVAEFRGRSVARKPALLDD
tara:strand:- start:2806 stop:3243 length:438 start_codon:yes stop_codon:yes gene_type:complete